MLTFPNCKINLGLYITSRRTDGYHDLETVFYPVPLTDALEFVPLSNGADQSGIQLYGVAVDGNADDNLVMKAYRLLRQDYEMPAIDISLYKHIPLGAGLGGGSSDATFMLRMLNEQFAFNISNEQLEHYASQLGADCAFFVRNVPVHATGIGDVFSSIDLSLKGYHIVIVKPDIFVSTREAFSKIIPLKPEYDLRETLSLPVSQWKDHLKNDFENSVFPQHPQLAVIKQKLYDCGALYAAMSGSGSSLFGIFGSDRVPGEDIFKGMFYFTGAL